MQAVLGVEQRGQGSGLRPDLLPGELALVNIEDTEAANLSHHTLSTEVFSPSPPSPPSLCRGIRSASSPSMCGAKFKSLLRTTARTKFSER